jgi:RNA polymerase sigma-70 factor, ECF subfamily
MTTLAGKEGVLEEVPETRETASVDRLYQQVATEFGPALHRLACAYEADPARRDDLLQDIYIRLWRSLASFKGECSLRTWVYRIAHNTASTYVVREHRNRMRNLHDIEELERIPDLFDGERAVDEANVIERVQQLIHRLRPLDRQVIVLHFEGLKPADIAKMTGLSANNVSIKIHRVRELLARHFNVEIAP